MAVTKLMHMKEAPGIPHTHLKNSLDYILDVKHAGEKTDFGRLAGGNCGTDSASVLEAMLATKRGYGKTDGRQGYHFVIAFPPGTATAGQTLEAAQMFCEIYLGDRYEYVYAVHTDTAHSHAHIVFNSVSVEDGMKYHYKKGDWGKYVQPVTDQVCAKLGLPELSVQDLSDTEPEPSPRLNSYACWMQENGGNLNRSSVFMADIDFAIQRSADKKEFEANMAEMGYTMRTGYSQKHGAYIAYTFHWTDENGLEKHVARRSYMLDRTARVKESRYGPEAIDGRIKTKEGPRSYEDAAEHLKKQADAGLGVYISISLAGKPSYRRLYQAVSYYKLPNPYAIPAARVRRDMIHMDKLVEECVYLKEHGFPSTKELEERKAVLDTKIKEADAAVRQSNELLESAQSLGADQLKLSPEEAAERVKLIEKLRKLDHEYDKALSAGSETAAEKIQDEMEQTERQIQIMDDQNRILAPEDYENLTEKRKRFVQEASAARAERKILKRIISAENEPEITIVPAGPGVPVQ